MKNVNRQKTSPVNWGRSKRNIPVPVITSFKPGVCVPLAAVGLFPEDAIVGRLNKRTMGWETSRISGSIEMAETKDRIMNKVRARVTAYFVPALAFERFNGSRDEWEKSFAGEQGLGGEVIPYLELEPYPAYGTSEFYTTTGYHGTPGMGVNTMLIEAGNIVWNFRAENRSPNITKRARLDDTLAPAFWPAGRLESIVPTFDEAVMDGQVALDVVNSNLVVRTGNTGAQVATEVSRAAGTSGQLYFGSDATVAGNAIIAELQQNGITISLANMEMAKKVQGFAKLRAQYEGLSDDYLIDTFLMNGVSLPDLWMKQPMLIADQTVTFMQAERYATNSGSLDEKAVSGVAHFDIAIRLPRTNTGGVVIVQVEVLPDQLFERQQDAFLHQSRADWPEAMRDYADPQKVHMITNGEIDTDHTDPTGLFGFAPLNWRWNGAGPRLGGKFIKPEAGGGTNVNRQRFWAHEEVDPALTESFFICQGLPTSIFLDEESDPFEIVTEGNLVIDGNTQFGPVLIEATDNYDKVMQEMDTARVEQEG